jgi:hypothetical protein
MIGNKILGISDPRPGTSRATYHTPRNVREPELALACSGGPKLKAPRPGRVWEVGQSAQSPKGYRKCRPDCPEADTCSIHTVVFNRGSIVITIIALGQLVTEGLFPPLLLDKFERREAMLCDICHVEYFISTSFYLQA